MILIISSYMEKYVILHTNFCGQTFGLIVVESAKSYHSGPKPIFSLQQF